MKVAKGKFGYINSEKKKRTLITLTLLAITAIIFITGYLYTGTRLNMFTFIAIMGWIPAAKFAVGMIMMLIQKPVDEDVYKQVEQKAGDLERAYELIISAYEKTTPLESLVICGYQVVGYTSSEKADCDFCETHITKILKGNGYKAEVKIFKDLKQYLERVETLSKKQIEMEKDITFTPSENYPDLTRSQLVKHTILAISL